MSAAAVNQCNNFVFYVKKEPPFFVFNLSFFAYVSRMSSKQHKTKETKQFTTLLMCRWSVVICRSFESNLYSIVQHLIIYYLSFKELLKNMCDKHIFIYLFDFQRDRVRLVLMFVVKCRKLIKCIEFFFALL